MDIAGILTLHGEGLLLSKSAYSMLEAAEEARRNGLVVNLYAVFDRPTEQTIQMAPELKVSGFKVLECDFGDQGQVRNFAARCVSEKYVAFLDGDDLWSFNWLCEAYSLAKKDASYVVHPELNLFFNGSENVVVHRDQRDDSFEMGYLRVANYWDALCFAPRATYLDVPYADRELKDGFAYEDWLWNCETILKGYTHVVARDTVIFKNRRLGSQTLASNIRRALIRDNELMKY
ncbi:glycosyltransferase family A protein [Biformimicrobium ophioploci]|uniref:Glycosyltransferase 2-like domain-containing protein n=1 Tax=Biformimicrobium ophioploci TaxID=3036711 RepID=A0ABQ6M313_9GAMM|nr:glycosyltransferase family A protein [Microbulbifer sp. NKW57]GMG88738.1 hypothetical protein MNKW57_30590 [Microbulbifer sp. NKW57]